MVLPANMLAKRTARRHRHEASANGQNRLRRRVSTFHERRPNRCDQRAFASTMRRAT